MEITEGVYDIPDGYRAKILIGAKQISIQKRKPRCIEEGDYRCKDCIHRVEGYPTRHRWYTSFVCELKPKKTVEGSFYAAPYGQKACKDFDLRNK
jgi:hypothetical protein